MKKQRLNVALDFTKLFIRHGAIVRSYAVGRNTAIWVDVHILPFLQVERNNSAYSIVCKAIEEIIIELLDIAQPLVQYESSFHCLIGRKHTADGFVPF
jgi:hypothetical protein